MYSVKSPGESIYYFPVTNKILAISIRDFISTYQKEDFTMSKVWKVLKVVGRVSADVIIWIAGKLEGGRK